MHAGPMTEQSQVYVFMVSCWISTEGLIFGWNYKYE